MTSLSNLSAVRARAAAAPVPRTMDVSGTVASVQWVDSGRSAQVKLMKTAGGYVTFEVPRSVIGSQELHAATLGFRVELDANDKPLRALRLISPSASAEIRVDGDGQLGIDHPDTVMAMQRRTAEALVEMMQARLPVIDQALRSPEFTAKAPADVRILRQQAAQIAAGYMELQRAKANNAGPERERQILSDPNVGLLARAQEFMASLKKVADAVDGPVSRRLSAEAGHMAQRVQGTHDAMRAVAREVSDGVRVQDSAVIQQNLVQALQAGPPLERYARQRRILVEFAKTGLDQMQAAEEGLPETAQQAARIKDKLNDILLKHSGKPGSDEEALRQQQYALGVTMVVRERLEEVVGRLPEGDVRRKGAVDAIAKLHHVLNAIHPGSSKAPVADAAAVAAFLDSVRKDVLDKREVLTFDVEDGSGDLVLKWKTGGATRLHTDGRLQRDPWDRPRVAEAAAGHPKQMVSQNYDPEAAKAQLRSVSDMIEANWKGWSGTLKGGLKRDEFLSSLIKDLKAGREIGRIGMDDTAGEMVVSWKGSTGTTRLARADGRMTRDPWAPPAAVAMGRTTAVPEVDVLDIRKRGGVSLGDEVKRFQEMLRQPVPGQAVTKPLTAPARSREDDGPSP